MKLFSSLVLLSFFVSSVAVKPLSCVKIRERQLLRPRLGGFVVSCRDDGSFEPLQCHGSSGYCFCVDKEGRRRGPLHPPTSTVVLDCDNNI